MIFGATRDDTLEGIIRVSVVATGIDHEMMMQEVADSEAAHREDRMAQIAEQARAQLQAAASVRPMVRPAGSRGDAGTAAASAAAGVPAAQSANRR